MTDLATDLTLLAIDKTIYLREQIQNALVMLNAAQPQAARAVLEKALEKTDVGTMKVWQPGEEPF